MRGVKRKAKRDSWTAPANFFVGTKKEEKIGRLRSCLRQAGGMTTTGWCCVHVAVETATHRAEAEKKKGSR
jgi:hypothetical protein